MLPTGCAELCPGCRYRGLSVAESAKRKYSWATRWLGERTSPIILPPHCLGYRRKTLLHARRGASGWELGLLKREGWEARLVPIPDCPAHNPDLNRALAALRLLLPATIPLAFVQVSGPLLTVVLKCHPQEDWRSWAKGTERALSGAGVKGLQINWNPSAGRRAFSPRHQEIIFGPRFLKEGNFFYGALSFRQQIPELEAHALDRALNFFRAFQPNRALDLYCGSGSSLALWLREGWNAAGVELGGEAVEAARLNAPDALVLKGKTEQRLPQLEEWMNLGKKGLPLVVFTNPPREGQAEVVSRWLLKTEPVAISYLSCNPKSLARDLDHLVPSYDLIEAQPYDFFPGTDHVEVLALLRHQRRSR